MPPAPNRLWCEHAWVDGRVEPGVAVEIAQGRFVSVHPRSEPGRAHRLGGLTIPGLANAHSHGFHRALRSRTQTDSGSFWTWRDAMYRVAECLDPGSYRRLARATFAEMAQAGMSVVGEFHYLHHQPDGTPYSEPNAMGDALIAAAAEAGIRITLLDTMYLHGGLSEAGYTEPAGAQIRYRDPSPQAWADRVDAIAAQDHALVGAAIHSVRAVDAESMSVAADWALAQQAPLHAHVSEQRAENQQCLAHHGLTPVALLAHAGALNTDFTAVHATHLNAADIDMLATSRSWVCMCPTTERDLGDGIGPTTELVQAGVQIALGSDSHAVIDHLEEARAVELDERLRSERRGAHRAAALMAMATEVGHRSLGWTDAGRIQSGDRADLTTITLDSVRTAGTPSERAIEAAVFAATAADITSVIVDGRQVVEDGRHTTIDVVGELAGSIQAVIGS